MPQPPTEAEIRATYRLTIDDLHAFVLRRCGDRDLTEDITQETWLRAVRVWHERGLPNNPAAWLTTVARNLLANSARRVPHESLDHHDLAAPDRDTAAEARGSLVMRAFARVPLAGRALLGAFHFDSRSVAEIAADHGLSERAVEGRLRRARQQLRHHVESDPDSEGELP